MKSTGWRCLRIWIRNRCEALDVSRRTCRKWRLAAGTLLESDTYLDAQYRRLRTKLGAPKARKAMANKLARIAYRMLKYGEKYVDKGKEFYEQKYRQLQIRMLTKKSTELVSQ